MESQMNKPFLHTLLALIFMILTMGSAQVNAENDTGLSWPQEISVDEGTIIIYQPQPEDLTGATLKARAAVSFEIKGQQEPLFAAIWFETQLETDHESRTAVLRNIIITNVRFPVEDVDKTKQEKFSAIVEKELMKRDLKINLDNLVTTLEYAEERKKIAADMDNTPPKIVFVNEPAVLISLDGAPQIREDEGVQRVMNTPFTIVQDPNNKMWYLNADKDTWYQADELNGDWSIAEEVSYSVRLKAPKPNEEDEPAQEDDKDGPAPKIILVTEPTELISSTGTPTFVPVNGTDLLYVSNTDSDVLLDIKEQRYYILLSGRWYTSKTTDGPWSFVQGIDLPVDFPSIPTESEVSNVRYAVPGTEEAEDAVMEAQLPQTATVDREKASLKVEYDGTPEFVAVESTELTYAVNTATPVIQYQGKYYAVDEAIWFVASNSTGTWQVATEIPAEIYKIPPKSPIYHVTFVHIYSHTPEVVYVGYTQGYTNVYIYHNTVIYGTGYYYPAWYGRYYYPRPSTWGFHARYSPRWGWSFGLSYSHGPFRFTIGHGGWYRGGWWGPSRYRGYSRGYRHGIRAGYRAGYRAGKRSSVRNNMYRSQRNQARTRNTTNMNRQKNKARTSNNRTSNRANNVYADRSGNVHRNNNGNWQQRTNQGWSNSNKGQATQRAQLGNINQNQQRARNTTTTPNRASNSINRNSSLNRSHQSRQRGNTKAMQSGGSRRR